ncbi:MAG: hypothetical protein HYY44_09650, partial [Deltaproteobacteria bacterium]|nr:hypothetical protein [Deltaproteobacteria bacterium]
MLGLGILPLFLPSTASANPKPASCYRKKEKKEEYTTEIAITAILLGSLLTVVGHKATFPKITRLTNRLLGGELGLPERFRLGETTITRFLFGTDYVKPSLPKNLLDKGIMFLTDRPFHLLGRIGFSIAAVELGLRSFMGYEHHLSGGGGIFSMF